MTTIEDQRVRLMVLDPQYPAYDDLVVTSRVNVFRSAFEARSEIRKQRHAVQPLTMFQAVELLVIALRKTVGKVFLVH